MSPTPTLSSAAPAAATAAPAPHPVAALPPLRPRAVRAPEPLVALEPRQLLLGLAGYLALPAVALVGASGDGDLVGAVAPPVAALFLSVPSLLTGHQFLGLHASPADLVRDIAHVFTGCGRLALGMVPLVGLYSATTGLGEVALVLSLIAIGLAGVELARRRLVRREAAAADAADAATFAGRTRMDLLALAWSVLALLIAGRMGLDFLVG